ncbi:hypothetical protein DS837_10725 [Azospirillum brasilense]|uniref:Uncharacterized protein n=1 Tax=Azospirillum brasilense TaxID=192 RepID=A0A6L3B533_AZOBR|nr:hypothetical protein DS837_10725 [Azospirillum brasilense]
MSDVQTGDTRSVEDVARQVVALERAMPFFALAPKFALVAICDAIGAQPRLRAEVQPDATVEELLQTPWAGEHASLHQHADGAVALTGRTQRGRLRALTSSGRR